YIDKNGDTNATLQLESILLFTKMNKAWVNYWQEWTRLRNAVYVTYPYAKATAKIINELNSKLKNVTSESERKKIIKSREKELKKEFSDKLTKLSVFQGKILMKLIYRETNNNCYQLIKEFKGTFSAFFWQSIAILFGSNLKQSYNKYDADKEIEKIVSVVEKMYGY
ncbi:MAG: DUF4294 domain-containing protein, partial [Sediminibacterium sp.]|nr:DUF4294 domain-containing protein [Sediminibacterium sp.]